MDVDFPEEVARVVAEKPENQTLWKRKVVHIAFTYNADEKVRFDQLHTRLNAWKL